MKPIAEHAHEITRDAKAARAAAREIEQLRADVHPDKVDEKIAAVLAPFVRRHEDRLSRLAQEVSDRREAVNFAYPANVQRRIVTRDAATATRAAALQTMYAAAPVAELTALAAEANARKDDVLALALRNVLAARADVTIDDRGPILKALDAWHGETYADAITHLIGAQVLLHDATASGPLLDREGAMTGLDSMNYLSGYREATSYEDPTGERFRLPDAKARAVLVQVGVLPESAIEDTIGVRA